jgi:superfamily II DNA or RNA helicase
VCGAEYRIGLSGSLNENPKNLYIWSQLGYIIHEINSEELIEQEYLAMPEIRMITIHNYDVLGTWPEVREEFIIHNEIRNNEIRVICIEDTGFVVIIVNLIEHGELLQKIIPDSEFINGELDKPTREKIMHDAREGKLKVLIGTVINEGIDLPNIDTIILAGGGKSDIQTIQSAGRVLRKNGLKTKTIIDFYDTGKYLREHSNERKKVYEKYGKVLIC